MIGIDTNILVRYIANDDQEQSAIASKLLKQYSGKEKSIFINNIVVCELIWVLERGYKYSKEQIIKALKIILSSVEFEFENHKIIFLATLEYEKNSTDFSDTLIGLINKKFDCIKTFSFDKEALKLKYFSKIDI